MMKKSCSDAAHSSRCSADDCLRSGKPPDLR